MKSYELKRELENTNNENLLEFVKILAKNEINRLEEREFQEEKIKELELHQCIENLIKHFYKDKYKKIVIDNVKEGFRNLLFFPEINNFSFIKVVQEDTYKEISFTEKNNKGEVFYRIFNKHNQQQFCYYLNLLYNHV